MRRRLDMGKIYDIISVKEKQATLKAAFVFLALLTSKQTAKQDEKRRMRGLASFYDIISVSEESMLAYLTSGECRS